MILLFNLFSSFINPFFLSCLYFLPNFIFTHFLSDVSIVTKQGRESYRTYIFVVSLPKCILLNLPTFHFILHLIFSWYDYFLQVLSFTKPVAWKIIIIIIIKSFYSIFQYNKQLGRYQSNIDKSAYCRQVVLLFVTFLSFNHPK